MGTTIRPITSHPPADSFWQDGAAPFAPLPPLAQDCKVDVLVVGAGVTGLSTALHLAQKGASVCVLEAYQPGWGASGRNGGQVNPTLKHDPDELVKLLGDGAEPLIDAVSRSADVVFDLIREHDMDCQPVRQGWLQLSYRDAGLPALHARAQQWARRGEPVEVLDRTAALQHTGSTVFRGGWWDKRAGSVQPLAYVQSLAGIAAAAGAVLHGDTVVTGVHSEHGRWRVETAAGPMVTADQLVLATNGYTDGLWPGLARTMLSANSFMVATRPLGSAVDHILPLGETLSTAERLLVYLRKTPEGRLLMGGRGLFADPRDARDFSHIEQALVQLYPELAPFEFDYHWGGRIAITMNFLPHVHRPAPGVTVALGYNGRGVALGTAMGRHLAQWLHTGSNAEFPFPITRIAPIPLHGLQRFYISAGVAWYGLLDRLGM